MRSDKENMMRIDFGIQISEIKKEKSIAYADKRYFMHPKNIGKLKVSGSDLFFAGGDDYNFKMLDLKVWGHN